MSVKKNLNELSDKEKRKIDKDLTIKLKSPIKNVPPKTIVTYNINDSDDVILPFGYGISNFNLKKTRPKRDFLPNINIEFTGELRPEQVIVKNEIVRDLNKTGSGCISAFPGFGKTCMAINIACSIKLKTLIIVNKIVLIKQWEESINIFSPGATIQKVKPRANLEDCDFYIINAQNVEKLGVEFFSQIGLCVVDEMHMIMAETLSRSLHYIFPRYLVGLSATPYRPDDLDILITYYFGNNKVIRELNREHHVYVIETEITYEIERTIDGRLNWGNLLDQQSEHKERNKTIINIVTKFSDRNFLILVKRVKQGKLLQNMLEELGEDVTSLLGNSQHFNKESRILIGTCQKVGVGFDHKKLDALLLATDIEEYFIQYLGRVFRTKNQIPIVFDLVDNQQTLKKHYKTRKEVYLKHGGILKSINEEHQPF
jgi:superfamily II DNA or RNA helicase